MILQLIRVIFIQQNTDQTFTVVQYFIFLMDSVYQSRFFMSLKIVRYSENKVLLTQTKIRLHVHDRYEQTSER